MQFAHYIEVFLSGLVSGCYYAALATALSLVFGINKIVNFAHGEFIMVGGFCYLAAAPIIGPLGAILLAFVLAAAIAYIFHFLVLNRRIATSSSDFSPGEYQVITTFALGMLLLNIALVTYGPDIRSVAAPFFLPRIRSEFFSISSTRLVGLVECVVLLAVVYVLHTFCFSLVVIPWPVIDTSSLIVGTPSASRTAFAVATPIPGTAVISWR